VKFLGAKNMKWTLVITLYILSISCIQQENRAHVTPEVQNSSTVSTRSAENDTNNVNAKLNSTAVQRIEPHFNYSTDSKKINTGNTSPEELLNYAKTLVGTPYRYGSTDPAVGFDCSGFITHVFNRFNIAVPRSSIDFTNVQTEIPLQDAKPGDLILFTGTDSTKREVGHMGIIVSNDNNMYHFIHSTSGKKYGVTITPLNGYYMGRYMKVVRVFRQ
jgi:cell wall-associated NlpC family hydrolase